MQLKKFIVDNSDKVRCFKGIEDFSKISVDVDIEEITCRTDTDDEYSCYVFESDGCLVRVPRYVLSQLSLLLKKHPTLKYFAVSKEGFGLGSKYTTKLIE